MRKILCLDFDGVIHSYTTPWAAPDIIPDDPVPGAIKFLFDATIYFDVAIFSSRSATKAGREAMAHYITKHMERYAEFNGYDLITVGEVQARISFPETNPPAFLSFDDRAMTFTGVFPDPVLLLHFKPWNK